MNKKRVVIKVGTSILTDARSPIGKLVEEICRNRRDGHEFLIVSSGAIGAGMAELKWNRRPEDIGKKQAAAAVGQVSLMQNYQTLFKKFETTVAQILLTRSDFEDRRRYLNARNTLLTLLELGVVPIINENDTVSVEEIQFGDNDRLSALVAAKIDADLLVLLTNVDGLYRSKSGEEKEVVPVVSKITPEIERMAWKGVKNELGTGGMVSKIEAAKIATASGVSMVIANAYQENVITDILAGKNTGTKFVSLKGLTAKERWILFGAVPKGELILDEGAVRALKDQKKSLLAAGVVEVRGRFSKKDVVRIQTPDGKEFARGVVGFSSEEIETIKGKKTDEIKRILSRSTAVEEVVHRNSLVLLP